MDKKQSEPQKVWEQSEVPCWNPPAQNDFEKSRPGSNGKDQSGMR